MKKRILIFAVIATMLLTMLAVPAFADEAIENVGRIEAPYYYFTLSVGDYLKETPDEFEVGVQRANSAYHVIGYDTDTDEDVEKWYVNVNSGSLSVLSWPSFYYDDGVGELVFSNGAGDLTVKFNASNQIVRLYYSKSGMFVEADTVTVAFNDYYTKADGEKLYYEFQEDPADPNDHPDTLVRHLEDSGIEVRYYDPSRPSHLVPAIFSGFGSAIGGIAGGLKSAFNGILYANGVGGAFSPLVVFIFVMAGLALALGIGYKIFGIIRARKG